LEPIESVGPRGVGEVIPMQPQYRPMDGT